LMCHCCRRIMIVAVTCGHDCQRSRAMAYPSEMARQLGRST
jgi:hypothetical protein